MIPPKVSVIIPTYNRAHLLPRAIKSVLNQTFKDFEIIIVDDGSTDNTEKVVREVKDERIIYLEHNVNKGDAVARNTGIKNSRGEYMAFLDSDDEWLPEKLEKQIELFRASPFSKRLGFVGCQMVVVNERNNKFFVSKKLNCRGDILEDAMKFLNTPLCGIVLKRKILTWSGFFDENLELGTDCDMWIKLAKDYYFDFVNEPLYRYYLHRNQITASPPLEKQIRMCRYVFEKHENLYLKHPKAKGILLRWLGTFNLLSGNNKKARQYFVESIKVSPTLRNILTFLFSFVGKKIYKKALDIKRKLFLG